MDKPEHKRAKLRGILSIYVVGYKYKKTTKIRPVCRSLWLERGTPVLSEEEDRILGVALRVEGDYLDTEKRFFYSSETIDLFEAFMTKENGVTLENRLESEIEIDFDSAKDTERFEELFEEDVRIRELGTPRDRWVSHNDIVNKKDWKPKEFSKLIIPFYENTSITKTNKAELKELIEYILPGINLKNFNIEDIYSTEQLSDIPKKERIVDAIIRVGCLLNIATMIAAASRDIFKLNSETLHTGNRSFKSLNKAGNRALDLLQITKRL